MQGGGALLNSHVHQDMPQNHPVLFESLADLGRVSAYQLRVWEPPAMLVKAIFQVVGKIGKESGVDDPSRIHDYDGMYIV
jgi:hypothetical protein